MKQGIHPDYREVVFQDEDAGFAFLTRSTIKTSETISWEDGNDYPLVKLEISSASHPFTVFGSTKAGNFSFCLGALIGPSTRSPLRILNFLILPAGT